MLIVVTWHLFWQRWFWILPAKQNLNSQRSFFSWRGQPVWPASLLLSFLEKQCTMDFQWCSSFSCWDICRAASDMHAPHHKILIIENHLCPFQRKKQREALSKKFHNVDEMKLRESQPAVPCMQMSGMQITSEPLTLQHTIHPMRLGLITWTRDSWLMLVNHSLFSAAGVTDISPRVHWQQRSLLRRATNSHQDWAPAWDDGCTFWLPQKRTWDVLF